MRETYDADLERIESDLTSFADPGGIHVISATGRRLQAEWQMRGEPREANFTVSRDHEVTASVNGTTQPYTVFLADTRMADLKHVARMIYRSRQDKIFVPTGARCPDGGGVLKGPQPATELLTELMEDDEPEVTEVIMATGGAGAGKTRVLQELVWQQADRYLRGSTGKLLLYVNAQGRALARLHEALATELQDLRVNLTYHSVATLVRVGLLVPVIDGFDELLGISGYDDAFSTLATFLEQLDGYGRIITSARSTYYEEEFLRRADRAAATGKQRWSHIPVEIAPWDDAHRSDYLNEIASQYSLPTERKNELRKKVRAAFQQDSHLMDKPLFFAKTVDLVLTGSEFSEDGNLLDTLIHSLLKREQAEKILDRQQRPLLSEDQLEMIVRELAEEMWNQETRELDGVSVREVAEFFLHDEIDESERQIIIERMPTLAFLTHSEKHETIGFEHEVYFFYFLARVIAEQYGSNSDLRAILSRAALPELVAERFAAEVMTNDTLSTLDDLQVMLNRLAMAGRDEWRRASQVRENAGLIVLSLLKAFASNNEADIAGLKISNVIFPGGDLSGVTLRNCTLDGVTVRRTNLRTTRFLRCHARNVLLEEPMVEIGSTRLELNGLRVPGDVAGVQNLTDKGRETIRIPDKIVHVLSDCGTPVDIDSDQDKRNVSDRSMELLEWLMHTYERANPVCDGDDNMRLLFDDYQWPELRRILIKHGIVTVDRRSASGPAKEFLRRKFPPDKIMSGANKTSDVPPQIRRFWDDLEASSI